MMNDKELLQMLEVLGRNSRKSKSLSLAASVVSENKDNHIAFNDTKCAKTLRNIIESTHSRSLAASLTAANPSPNVNRVSVLYNFVINNQIR